MIDAKLSFRRIELQAFSELVPDKTYGSWITSLNNLLEWLQDHKDKSVVADWKEITPCRCLLGDQKLELSVNRDRREMTTLNTMNSEVHDEQER